MKILLSTLISSAVFCLWTLFLLKDGYILKGWITIYPPFVTSIVVVSSCGAIIGLISSLILWKFHMNWPAAPIVANLISLALVMIIIAVGLIAYVLVVDYRKPDPAAEGVFVLVWFVALIGGIIYLVFAIPAVASGILQNILLGSKKF